MTLLKRAKNTHLPHNEKTQNRLPGCLDSGMQKNRIGLITKRLAHLTPEELPDNVCDLAKMLGVSFKGMYKYINSRLEMLLICPRCGHGHNIRREKDSAADGGSAIYCGTPTPGEVFSRCFYHFDLPELRQQVIKSLPEEAGKALELQQRSGNKTARTKRCQF